ncbi:hypothetical protein BUALT_Bualt16G0124600 [Buddleja alternifolia]|uniref:SBP-type domain-containing protein n=1 Tax=Buddleja alternifolia TaxID=168488 RepID=A0AAV6WKD9_9LAMI|nr:hypothetical protein BUALT_Bualt16G0124600 [Buddleja alternifolia]
MSRMEKGSSSSSSSGGGDSVNGLNFGKKIYFAGGGPPPSPAKKGRTAAVHGGQAARCQVEGCNVDLSDAKAYYSRHKVCGMHSKSPKVIVSGLEQRFCQQCSRFHQLPEFDQGKRSCRRRLAGHNERRRKPPPGPLLSPRFESLSPSMFDNDSKNGGFVMDFSAYPTLGARDSWPNTTTELGLRNEATTITGKYQLPWQSNSQNHLLQGSTTRPSFNPGPGSSEDCYSALSLLSNQPWAPRTRASSSNNFHGTNGSTMVVNPGQIPGPSWGFKDNQDNNTMHEMPPDIGLGQISQPGNTGQYGGDLRLGQRNERQFGDHELSRGYDSSVQHMHWSL